MMPPSLWPRFRVWWRQRWCTHVITYDNAGRPIYSLRPIKMTTANYERWWAWSLGEHVCPECGMRFMDCRTEGRPL